MGAHLPSNVNHYFHDCFLVMSSRYHFCRCQYINITDANIMILRYRYLNEKTMFLGRSYTRVQPFWISHAHLSRMTEVVAKVDSGEKTSCFLYACNGNLTLLTYLGIKLMEIDTYNVYSM